MTVSSGSEDVFCEFPDNYSTKPSHHKPTPPSDKGQIDDIFLDEDTNLVVKVIRPWRDPQTGVTNRHEIVYDEYQEMDGLMLAAHVRTFRDGKQVAEARLLEFRLIEPVPEHLFTPPAAETRLGDCQGKP